jgi:hypothetical protein
MPSALVCFARKASIRAQFSTSRVREVHEEEHAIKLAIFFSRYLEKDKDQLKRYYMIIPGTHTSESIGFTSNTILAKGGGLSGRFLASSSRGDLPATTPGSRIIVHSGTRRTNGGKKGVALSFLGKPRIYTYVYNVHPLAILFLKPAELALRTVNNART